MFLWFLYQLLTRSRESVFLVFLVFLAKLARLPDMAKVHYRLFRMMIRFPMTKAHGARVIEVWLVAVSLGRPSGRPLFLPAIAGADSVGISLFACDR